MKSTLAVKEMEGSGCFVIDYVLKVSSNCQKMSAAHYLLIKC